MEESKVHRYGNFFPLPIYPGRHGLGSAFEPYGERSVLSERKPFITVHLVRQAVSSVQFQCCGTQTKYKKKGSRETVSVPSSPSGIVLGLRNECVFHVTYWNTAECSWTLVLSFSSFSLSSSSYLHFFCPSSSLAFFLCLCFIFLILSRAIHIVRTLNICVKKESS